MTVNIEVLDHNQVECDPDGVCALCGSRRVVTIDLFQNVKRAYPHHASPWACLECCQQMHETLTAALEAGP